MTFSIHTHRWYPSGAPTQTRGVYIVHGASEHGMRYDRLARYLTERGYVVGAHDHPGHGKSDGERGIIRPEQPLIEHASHHINEFAKETGAEPILFGHSLGGVVAATVALDANIPLAGLILSAPAFKLSISPINKIKLYLFNAIAPYHAQDLGYDPTRLTRDKTEQQSALDDPLMHGHKSGSYVTWLIKAGEAAFNRANQLSLNTLLLVPEADIVVSADRIKEFAANAPQDKVIVKSYKGFKHEALNEAPEHRNRVKADIGQWLQDNSL